MKTIHFTMDLIHCHFQCLFHLILSVIPFEIPLFFSGFIFIVICVMDQIPGNHSVFSFRDLVESD